MIIPGTVNVFDTSVFSRKVAIAASSSVEVIGPSDKRIGFLISGGGADMSFSWQPNPILNFAAVNFFGSLTYSFFATVWLIGTAINQPMYGVGSGEGQIIEVTEFLYNGPGNPYEIIITK